VRGIYINGDEARYALAYWRHRLGYDGHPAYRTSMPDIQHWQVSSDQAREMREMVDKMIGDTRTTLPPQGLAGKAA